MDKGKLILVLGGAKSGKSRFAEKLAVNISSDVTYVATAAVLDDEMARKVALHRASRPQHWQTIEETTNLVDVIKEHGSRTDVILIDCLTLWLSNLLLDANNTASGISWADKESFILSEVKKLASATVETRAAIIVVANEVSLGLIPDNRLGRAFREVAGLANQVIADYADEVYLIVAGIPMEIKSLAFQNLS
ncbi:adenosylcobinamide kinase/adenosylcobinamide-phosphate guanylyltransferase [Desulfohalotomaculum tongense]|uniref:bifunctional adenosylcobinamide kinase/adenosylcobinamide-phosphate guanylyltransferase n=1 Tax=Desulforadius tongensis TaxID=1216062 RepID=UPI00195E3AC7|nr:bifunctional adenosylcobinamide kinase/adenosylcobinamide-phosphate guanylyltransferase [Desulforadius tongensis]MBM7854486.1 adenosylcobinamide kinase/adenosylcobinamide-phosphate guanylyltransferase [Desulforadius tongensis]